MGRSGTDLSSSARTSTDSRAQLAPNYHQPHLFMAAAEPPAAPAGGGAGSPAEGAAALEGSCASCASTSPPTEGLPGDGSPAAQSALTCTSNVQQQSRLRQQYWPRHHWPHRATVRVLGTSDSFTDLWIDMSFQHLQS